MQGLIPVAFQFGIIGLGCAAPVCVLELTKCNLCIAQGFLRTGEKDVFKCVVVFHNHK